METEEHLKVFRDRSELVRSTGSTEKFLEGPSSRQAKTRIAKLKSALDNGYFEKLASKDLGVSDDIDDVTPEIHDCLKTLVDSVTSEYGRAVVALTVFQLAIKAVIPEQSVRLHKGSTSRGSFSWVEGVPMRSIDKKYITPVLRRYGLISLNADGMFMTRSLAENYPYSKVYKAEIRGAKDQWHKVIDHIEDNPGIAEKLLIISIGLLRNRSNIFAELVERLEQVYLSKLDSFRSLDFTVGFILSYVDQSGYSARVFEIALHSLFQVLDEELTFDGILQPLGQMRTPNKKKGNIGDIEISEDQGGVSILESWDAKYGKSYLREEIEEVYEKFQAHPNLTTVGFVTNLNPDLKKEVVDRILEIKEISDIDIKIFDFNSWVRDQISRASLSESLLAQKWMKYFIECISQKRREQAPIDEPCDNWVREMIGMLEKL